MDSASAFPPLFFSRHDIPIGRRDQHEQSAFSPDLRLFFFPIPFSIPPRSSIVSFPCAPRVLFGKDTSFEIPQADHQLLGLLVFCSNRLSRGCKFDTCVRATVGFLNIAITYSFFFLLFLLESDGCLSGQHSDLDSQQSCLVKIFLSSSFLALVLHLELRLIISGSDFSFSRGSRLKIPIRMNIARLATNFNYQHETKKKKKMSIIQSPPFFPATLRSLRQG